MIPGSIKCPGGFVVKYSETEIVIENSDKLTMISSADGGGYSENFDMLTISDNVCSGKGFHIISSADPKSASLVSMTEGKTSVTALAIADPVCSEESADPYKGYMTSVVVMVDANMPQATMARTAMTSTEAITCAFQELMVGCPHSNSIASGSESVCVTVLSNKSCGKILYNAGKHSKLGELIGKTVKKATISSMGENNITLESQADVFRRLERFGITKGTCIKYLIEIGKTPDTGFEERLDSISKDVNILAIVCSVIHIADEISWGLIPHDAGYEIGHEIICRTLSDNIPERDLIRDLVAAISQIAADSKDH